MYLQVLQLPTNARDVNNIFFIEQQPSAFGITRNTAIIYVKDSSKFQDMVHVVLVKSINRLEGGEKELKVEVKIKRSLHRHNTKCSKYDGRLEIKMQNWNMNLHLLPANSGEGYVISRF